MSDTAAPDNEATNAPKRSSLMSLINKLLLVALIVVAVVLYMRSVEQGKEASVSPPVPEEMQSQPPVVEEPVKQEAPAAETASTGAPPAEQTTEAPPQETATQSAQVSATPETAVDTEAAASPQAEGAPDDGTTAQTVPELSQEDVLRQIQAVFAPEMPEQGSN